MLDRRTLCLAFLLAPAAAAAATPPPFSRAALAARQARRFPQPVRVGDVIGRTVLEPLESQPILGHVRAIVRRPDGALDVIVAYGGLLGFGTRPIAVPIEAVALMGEYVAIMDFKPAVLRHFPTDSGGSDTQVPAGSMIRMGIVKPFH